MKAHITTFSGRTINLASPSPDDIDIGDIAHALSLLCRFNGHCRDFYSVAEHSVRVSLLLEDLAKDHGHEEHTQLLCLMGLLHDAAEAYPPGDLAAPLKKLLRDMYGEDGLNALDVQNSFDNAVRTRFLAHIGLAGPENAWALVEQGDRMLLAWEWRDIMGRRAEDKPDGIGKPHTEEKLWPWHSIKAEVAFLARFQQLAPDRPMLDALRRIVPEPMVEPEKGGWRTQLNSLVLKECKRIVDPVERIRDVRNPIADLMKKARANGEVKTKVTSKSGLEAEIAIDSVPIAVGSAPEFAEALSSPPPNEQRSKKRRRKKKRKKRRKCEHKRLAQSGKCLICDQQVLGPAPPPDEPSRSQPKRKRKKKRKGYSAEDVERMIAKAVEEQAVDSMSAPKRGAPGSSPDFAQPVPKQQKLAPTEEERAAMDDPNIREAQSEKIQGGRGLGSAAYADG